MGAKDAYLNAEHWKDFSSSISDSMAEITETEDVKTSDEKGTYQVNTPEGSEGNPTVAITADDNVSGNFVIQEKVKDKDSGTSYTVTAIASSAFENNKGLTSVSIPSTIISIGASAFAGCTNLKSITVNIVTPIALPISAGTRGMTRAGGSSVFEGVNKETCILYVPAGSVDTYKQAAGWKDFKNILAIGTTAINGVVVSEGKPFDVYNLLGRKVKANTTTFKGLPAGVYIVNGKKISIY